MPDISDYTPPWADWPEVKRVMDTFAAAKVPVCFIGGCVRDAFLGKSPGDFDIVVASPFPETQRILKQAGIESHTPDARFEMARAAVNGKQFDFLHSASDDRARPFPEQAAIYVHKGDFTVNGLYWFPPNTLRDEVGAREDIAAGRIRFMGEIKEELERYSGRAALRFFRFHAWFGKGDPDAATVETCVAYVPRWLHLKRATISSEMRKLLSAPQPYAMLSLMHRCDALKYALGFPIRDYAMLDALARVEHIRNQPSAWQVRLSLLLMSAPLPPDKALAHLVKFWGMDQESEQRLAALLAYSINDAPPPDMAQDVLLVRWALEEDVDAAQNAYLKALPL